MESMNMPTEEIIASPGELAQCLREIEGCAEIGFDTEFIGEQTFVPQLCLIQVSTWERLYLIDPLAAGPLDDFWAVVADPNRRVVAHAAREEIRICQRSCGRLPHGIFDLQIAAGLIGLGYPLGHAPLVNKLLNVRLVKGETLTDWMKRPLTAKQVQYAYDDVRYLLPAWRAIQGQLDQLGRTTWAREEFEALLPRSLGEEPGVERWRKLKGLGGLDRRKLGCVRALHTWREEKALEKNRPVRTIVRDDLLIEIARRNPRSEADLEIVRGLAKRDLCEMIEVVQRVRAAPPDSLPEIQFREDDSPPVALVATLLGAVLHNECARLHLSPPLVATTSDVKLLVRAHHRGEAPPEDCGLAHGWRAAAVLPELLAVLDGRRRVRIDDLRRADPLCIEG